MRDYPTIAAMKSAVELEIHAALGAVQTVVIGQMIQKAIDASAAWQPIDTAPKDGTSGLLCDARRKDVYLVGYWSADDTNAPFYWAQMDGDSYHQDAFTHWMSTPPAPVTP